jgi:hydrogenase nickel incorporation protein HypB
LGESVRAAMLSVTEGEDKPLKYPGLFNTSDVAVITKCDLATVCEFNRSEALDNIQSVRPGLRVIETSAKSGLGLLEWIEYLEGKRAQLNRHAC